MPKSGTGDVTGLIKRKAWDEFRKTGLLWFINTLLHTFGWALVVEYEGDVMISAYPARVKYRGFDKETEDLARQNLAAYMRDNAAELYTEADYPSTK